VTTAGGADGPAGLRLYNTLTRRKEAFTPGDPGRVGMYVCGITPYDHAHVGHARSALVFDVLRRYLAFRGYPVTFVSNYTDVDDKIIARAAQAGEAPEALAARFIQSYEADMAALGVAPPDVAPRATGHVPEMIAWIERLVRAEAAYPVEGDVYFAVRRFPGYGRLAGRSLDELRAGARVEVDERKRDPLDFALWKSAKPGEPAWPSPWGPGRPGWHIECSVMSTKYLGESFDLHGGGQDLVFPHHENEIAQAEAATGRPFVRYWVHNGFVNLGAEKMSKSLGNVLRLGDLLGSPLDADALRLLCLQTHYRGPIEFTPERLAESREAVWRWAMLVGRASLAAEDVPAGTPLDWRGLSGAVVEAELARLAGDPLEGPARAAHERFVRALDDDLGTPQAVAVLAELGAALQRVAERVFRRQGAPGGLVHGVAVFQMLARVLGLLWRVNNPFEFPPGVRAWMDPLVEAREEARGRRDFARADQVRGELDARGVVVEDTPWGPRPRWKSPPARA
jgi:cysteinyl-tRNA synthetase